MMHFIVPLVFAVIFIGYLWLKLRYLHWENRRVPYLRPESLLFGNNSHLVLGKLSLPENVQKLYNALAPHRFGGFYHFQTPILCVRDPELIKHIMIKDFNHFRDRELDIFVKEDVLTKNLFHLAGEEWRVLRHKLTPTFTSGKMKMLFGLMKNCAVEMKEIIEQSAQHQVTIDVKDLMARYSTDIISSCAFGVEANSLQNPNSEFRLKGKEIFAPTLRNTIRNTLFSLSPSLVHLLRLHLFGQRLTDFFVNWIGDTIKYRNENGVVRNDFLNLLINIQKEETANGSFDFNEELLTAQCFVFFAAGFETTSTSLGFILYELAEHKDVQEKLQDEVDHVLQEHNGQISYDSLQDMRYMDKIFNETSRLYPALSLIPRICTEDYRIPNSDCTLKRGDRLIIPVYGLHRDPQYYPDPEVFDPENFSEEAKASRPSCCFLPFGDGPRNCIGMRFAVMQVKLALTTIMKEFSVTLSPKMKLPIELAPHNFATTSRNEILLNFQRRNAAENLSL